MSIRLSEKEKEQIKRIAKEEGKDQSSVVRELIKYGEKYRTINNYREGKISLGQVAEELEISIREAMDLLTEHGIKTDIDHDELLQGHENLKQTW